MKILKCHVDDFGKLHDLDLDFENGGSIKEICAPNGWGKSTLAAFIRSMFYGFSPNQSRKVLENDRLRYLPWNKGVCGGNLTFSVGSKKYRIYRTFGKKAGEDTFVLHNADTNLPTDDYSSNLGEELFKIDRDSFIKTIFVEHTEVNVASSTNSINAKIGGISNVENDLKNLDDALEKCKNYINNNSDGRKTGKLHMIKDEIIRYRRICDEKDTLDKAITAHKKEKDSILEELNKLHERQKEITEEQKKLADHKQLLEQADRYRELLGNEKSAGENYEKSLEYFDGGVTAWDTVNDLYETNESLKDVLRKKEEAENRKTFVAPEDEENYKAESAALQERIAGLDRSIQDAEEGLAKVKSERDTAYEEYSALKTEVLKIEGELESRDREKSVLEENAAGEMKKADKAAMKLREAEEYYASLLRKKEEYELQARLQQKEASDRAAAVNRRAVITAGISAVLLIAGIILLVLKVSAAAGAVLAALGLIGLMAGVLMKISSKHAVYSDSLPGYGPAGDEERERARKAAEEYSRELDEQNEAARKARQKISAFEESGSDKKRSLEAKREKLAVLSSGYENRRQAYDDTREAVNGFRRELAEAKARLASNEDNHRKIAVESAGNETRRLEDLKNLTNKAGEITATLLDNINACIREKFMVPSSGAPAVFDEKINEIRKNIQQAESLKSIYDEAVSKASEFAGNNPAAAKLAETASGQEDFYKDYQQDRPENNGTTAVEPADDPSSDPLNAELDAIESARNELMDRLNVSRNELDNIIQSRDEVSEAEELLKGLEEEFAEGKKKLETVKKTKAFLESSRESFISGHMSPVQKNFDKYYEMLTGEKQTVLTLNAHMELMLMVGSDEKKTEALSSGYRDLIGLCFRMALADEMFKNEKPFIILDDPLSNLDDDKVEHGRDFIGRLSEEYQIIYLTCNNARKLS